MTSSNLAAPKWGRTDIDTLVELYGIILNAELGGSLETKRSADAVYSKARSLGITSPDREHWRKHPDSMRKRVLILAMRDYSLSEIAAEMGTGKLWAQRVLEAHPYYHRKWKARASDRRSRAQKERLE